MTIFTTKLSAWLHLNAFAKHICLERSLCPFPHKWVLLTAAVVRIRGDGGQVYKKCKDGFYYLRNNAQDPGGSGKGWLHRPVTKLAKAGSRGRSLSNQTASTPAVQVSRRQCLPLKNKAQVLNSSGSRMCLWAHGPLAFYRHQELKSGETILSLHSLNRSGREMCCISISVSEIWH